MDFRVSNVCVYLCVQFHTDAEIFFRCCVDVVAAALSFQFNGIFHFVDLFSVVFFFIFSPLSLAFFICYRRFDRNTHHTEGLGRVY